MAAAIAISANPLQLSPVTITCSGLSVTSPYVVLVTTADGTVQDFSGTSDGSGNYVVTIVPQLQGTYSVTCDPNPAQTVSASASFTVTGAP